MWALHHEKYVISLGTSVRQNVNVLYRKL